MDDAADLRAKLLAMEHVTAALWANVLRHDNNPATAFERVSEQSLNSLESVLDGGTHPSAERYEVTQAILHHGEVFWRIVRAQMEGVDPR